MPRNAICLTLLALLHVALAVAYNFATPAATADQHNPDENAHLRYVQTIAGGHLPVFHAGTDNYEAHQPPLYYIACAPVYAAASPAAVVRAVRGVSTVCTVFLLLVTFLAARALFPERQIIALTTAAFVALLPMNVSLSAAITNDALADLLMAAALWRLVLLTRFAPDAAQSPARWTRHALWLGVALGLGLWTKTSALLLFAPAALACYLVARQGLTTPALAARAAAVSLGLGAFIAVPWLARNQILYGDPLAQHIFETSFTNTAQAPDLIRYVFGGSMTAYLAAVARWTFASFWGVFDSMRLWWGRPPHIVPAPGTPLPPIYDALALLSLASLAGLARPLRPAPRLSPPQVIVFQSFAILIALTGLAHLRFILVFFQAQGRYWYPALLPLALFFALGLGGWLSRRAVFLLVTLGLIALNLYTLFGLLLPRFHRA